VRRAPSQESDRPGLGGGRRARRRTMRHSGLNSASLPADSRAKIAKDVAPRTKILAAGSEQIGSRAFDQAARKGSLVLQRQFLHRSVLSRPNGATGPASEGPESLACTRQADPETIRLTGDQSRPPGKARVGVRGTSKPCNRQRGGISMEGRAGIEQPMQPLGEAAKMPGLLGRAVPCAAGCPRGDRSSRRGASALFQPPSVLSAVGLVGRRLEGRNGILHYSHGYPVILVLTVHAAGWPEGPGTQILCNRTSGNLEMISSEGFFRRFGADGASE